MSAGPVATCVARAAGVLQRRLAGRAPGIGIVLGSGLGALITAVDDAVHVPFAEIPGFPDATVEGHAGEVVSGVLEEREVLVLSGRSHLYEGIAPSTAALPVRVMHALGIHTLLVSNAAGGIRRTFRAGDLMLIADQLNLTWRNSLVGPVLEGELRFPDMSAPYDPVLLAALREAARATAVPVVEGVYVGVLGPSYETPAEVRMLERLGADAVGMSTVGEVVVARALGMRVAGVSCITNSAAGLSGVPLDHAEVMAVTARVRARFVALVREFVKRAG